MLELMSFWFALMQSRVLASMKSSNLQFLAGEEKKDRFFFFVGFGHFLAVEILYLEMNGKKEILYTRVREFILPVDFGKF